MCCVVLHSANPGHEDLFLAGSRASGLNVDVCARGFAPCSWRCYGCSTVVLMGFACPAMTVVTVAAETQCESIRSTVAQHAVLYAHCYVGPPSPSIETTLWHSCLRPAARATFNCLVPPQAAASHGQSVRQALLNFLVLRSLTPHHTGWHTRRRFGLCWRRTGSFVLRCRSQAAGDPTAGQGPI